MLLGTNLQDANSYNNRIILETIRLHGPISRVGIARRTQLTAQTVTNIMRNLMKAGLVVEHSRESGGRGAPSILMRINEKAGYSVGVEFDKDHLTAILIDFNGRICQKKSILLHNPTPDEAFDLITSSTYEIIGRQGIDKDLIWGIGLGLPGPLAVNEQEDATRVVNPEAFPGWENVPIFNELQSRLQMPLMLENNASAAAIGEHWYGDGKHTDSFFYIYFGAGLGGGIVINGQLHSGNSSNAGELGYFPTSALTDPGKHYHYDHLGAFFDMPRLQYQMRKRGFDIHSMHELELLFSKEPDTLSEWLEEGAKSLVPLILAIDYLLDPQAIFLGGRLPEPILKSLLEKLTDLLPPHRIAWKKPHPKFRIASAGIDAAALGIASLPLYASFSPHHRLFRREFPQRSGMI